jgi:ABC-type sugar transport system substrate-binding protein
MCISASGANLARCCTAKRIAHHYVRLATSVLMTALAVGCDRSSSSHTVSAIPPLASQEIYLSERVGLEEAAAPSEIHVDWNGPSDPDPQRQVDLMSTATASNRYGIVLNPLGSNTLDSAIRTALARKIPVVIARDSVNLPPQPHLSFLLEDHDAGASLVTSRLNKIAGGQGNIVVLGLEPYSINSISRFDAVERALRRDCAAIRVVDRVIAPYSTGDVQIAAERALLQHPSLTAFIALNNRAGWGAAAAVKAARKPGVRIIVFDQSLPLLLRLRRGEVDSIVVQDMRTIGNTAIHNIEADRHQQPYNHSVLFKPMLVTLENIDLQSTQRILTLNWDLK